MSSALNVVPIPFKEPIGRRKRSEYFGNGERIDEFEGRVTDDWIAYFTQQGLVGSTAPSRVASVPLAAQAASIGATDISNGALSAGLYELTYYAQITQAATVSSSLTVVLDWTNNGQVLSFTGAAMTGNVLTTYQAGPTNAGLIRIDALSPVRYSTTYVSVGATPMLYALDVVLIKVEA